MHDLLADRAEQEAREPAAAAVPHDDELGVARFFDQGLGGLTLLDPRDALDRRLQLMYERDRLLDNVVGGVSEPSQRRLIEARTESAAVDRRRNLPCADNGEPRLPERSLLGCELERGPRRIRPIHPDNDLRHRPSPYASRGV
jgi:hypothetical protein